MHILKECLNYNKDYFIIFYTKKYFINSVFIFKYKSLFNLDKIALEVFNLISNFDFVL